MSHTSRFTRTPFAAALLALAALPPSPAALGQELVLEEVIVTAQRRQTMLQDTPIAVTAFNSEKIADLGIYDVSDISGLAPNTNIQKQPSSNSNMSIYIRGVGNGETSLMADPKTSFYLDGVYMSKTVGAVFDIVDLESVEVLRGPQGTLFGRNSTGGALNVTTVKPTGEFGLKAEANLGNDGYQRTALSVDTPQLFGMLSAKVSGMLLDYDGWAENDFPGGERELASEDNEAYRIALRLEPTDSLTIDYVYDRTNNEGVPTPFQVTKVKDSLFDGFTTSPVPFSLLGGQLYQQMAALVGDPDERREDYTLDAVSTEWLDVEGQTLTVGWELGPFMLKYIYGDRETNSGYDATDLDGGALTAPDLFYGGGMEIPSPGFHATIDEGWVDLQTHELQLIGDAFNDRLQYTLGYYQYEEEIYQSNPQTFSLPIQFLLGSGLDGVYTGAGFCNPLPDGSLFCQGSQRLPLPFGAPGADPNLNGQVDFIYGQTTESWAAYGQATYALTDDLDITAGIRYTEDDRSAFLFNENIGQSSFDERLTNSDTWDNISYLFTVNYAVTDSANVYATYSTGYNSGAFNSRASTISAWENPVDEEELFSWELGLKSDWLDSRLRFNAALFYNDYQDIQVTQFEAGSGGASSRVVNAGEATFQGLELELTALLTRGLLLELTYGYLDAEFDEYLARNPATDMEEDIADVTTVTRAPENSGNLGLQYEFDPFSFGTLSARLDVVYTDGFTFHPFQNQYDSADDRTLVNARVSLKEIGMGSEGSLAVSGWVKNATDEEYREWGIDFGSLGFAGDTYGRPRTYGVDVVYRFR
ncbi:TonB-dependent receptor [Parahaliea mediterranea]|uniref:TonB-dependent receptor n=1 Tax=Parahaliea mediterranea TaxID=651086 RepID=A0A939IIP7_9GAMM|nr:TonB-dependent receptor [Parahaliea mediterranea]MBN7796829.1 TonB-dependent receptor [Parahaliea mediterranea]